MARDLWCMFVISAWTTVLFPLSCVSMLAKRSGSASMFWVQKIWAPVMVWASGSTVKASGLENVDPRRPTIYVCNHQSTLDIPVLFMSLPIDFRFVAKSIVKWVPVLGWYCWLAGFVFVDRGNRRKAIASLDAAATKIRNGINIMMFAEGTRSEDGAILPFKKGPFALAVKAGVAICPVAIEGTHSVMPKNSWTITPGEIRVKVGAPIDPAPFGDDRDALMRHVRNQVIDLNLQLGGKGGDRGDAIAAVGPEGRSEQRHTSQAQTS